MRVVNSTDEDAIRNIIAQVDTLAMNALSLRRRLEEKLARTHLARDLLVLDANVISLARVPAQQRMRKGIELHRELQQAKKIIATMNDGPEKDECDVIMARIAKSLVHDIFEVELKGGDDQTNRSVG